MKILDKYIVGRFVKNLIWAMVSAITVFIVLDNVEQLDKFIDKKVPAVIVGEYYLHYIPYIIYLTLPIATLLSTLFTVGGMTRTNELVAMQASGISFGRTLWLLLSTSTLIAFGVFVLGETIVPHSNQRRLDIYRYEVKKVPRESSSNQGKLYLQIGTNQQLYIQHYRQLTREAYEVKMIEVDNGRIVKSIEADKMVWLNQKWLVQGAIERHFHEDGSVDRFINDTLTISGETLRPNELENIQILPEEMNWSELREFIHRLKLAGSKTLKWEVELLSKVAMPTAAIVIVLFGAPLAAVKRRGGTALGFGLSLFICFIYFGFIQVGKIMGYNGSLTPFMSAWIGNIFFGLLGIGILIKRAR